MIKAAENAYIDPKAELADDVEVGPFSFIGPGVVLGPGCRLHNNVTLKGPTIIGEKNEFHPNCVIGADPQDLKYKGGRTELVIGSRNIFREGVTANRGTELGGGRTVVGNDNFFMAMVHIGHDSVIEDHVIIANNVLIGGHVKIEVGANVGGAVAMHHWTTIGRYTMVGGMSRIVVDVPPFMIYEGDPGEVRSVNVRGLIRNGFSDVQVEAMKTAYKKLFRRRQSAASLAELEQEFAGDENVLYLVGFMRRREQGRFGRYLETLRRDTPADLPEFYKRKDGQV